MLLRFLLLATFAVTYPSLVEAQQETAPTNQAGAADTGWVELVGADGAVGLKKIAHGVTQCGDVSVSADSKVQQAFGDCEVQLEFLIGKGSNSGIKLQGLYEVQLYDSHGKENPDGTDCGGIYPHWEFKTKYWRRKLTYTDEGYPPLVRPKRHRTRLCHG